MNENEELMSSPQTPAKKYYCYFLGQPDNYTGQTYNGYTVNLNRRLRQHNGEIKGGAWATTKKGKDSWEFIAILSSDSWTSVSEAMSAEWNCRYPTRKKPRPGIFAGSKGRISSLVEIFKHIQYPIRLYVNPIFYDYAESLCLPENVVMCKEIGEL